VSGNLTVDTNTLFVDAAANTVSIGSTIAGVALNVASSAANTMALTRAFASGNATISAAVGKVQFGTNSTTANFIGAEIVGVAAEAWTAGSAQGSNLVFGTAANGATTLTERMRLTSGGAMVVGNGDAVASPAAATIRGTDGSGTDIAGAALFISGGRGTGSGAGGSVIFQTSAAGASGTTLRTATERGRFDPAGRFLVGASSGVLGFTNTIERVGSGSASNDQPAILIVGNTGTTAAQTANLQFLRTRGTTNGSVTAVAAGDRLGILRFRGGDGTSIPAGAEIFVDVDGTVATNDMPGRMVFATTPGGSASPSERLRIDNQGNVLVNTAAVATSAANGFLYIPTCAGAPTGTPTSYTGRSPLVVDSTNNRFYVYVGGSWKYASLT
jgi:hypothetical protein